MAWIESHTELARHPKTLRLARLLAVSLPAAIGHLHLLWHWALEYSQDGDLGILDDGELAMACLWDGEPERLRRAFIGSGFVDDDDRIHDWEDYAGRLMAQRAHIAQRASRNRTLYADMALVRAVRARDGDVCRYCGKPVNWQDRKSPDGGTYDHIDPEAGNALENVVVACRGCNSSKGRRTPEQAGKRLIPADTGKSPAEYPYISRRISADYPPTVTGPDRTVTIPPRPLVPSSSPEGETGARARPSRARRGAPDADAPDAFPLASSDDESTTKRTRQASWQTHLLAAFDALDLPAPQLDGAEGRAARRLVTQHGAGDVAACWAAIAGGEWGDAFDQRQLSFSHLAGKNRLSNWLAQRNGTYRPPISHAATPQTGGPYHQPQSQQRQPLPPDLPDVGELTPVSAADFAKFAREARRRQSTPPAPPSPEPPP